MKPSITYERANELFSIDYSSIYGHLVRKIPQNNNKAKKGDIAGCIGPDGRVRVNVDKYIYLGHRVVWLIHHGYNPENEIDHIDRTPHHNHPDNLRNVTRQCNLRNCGLSKNNTTGVTGVVWVKHKKTWVSQIWEGNKTRNLGYYEDFSEAVCVRLAAEQCFGWTNCNSSSPAYRYVQKMLGRQ